MHDYMYIWYDRNICTTNVVLHVLQNFPLSAKRYTKHFNMRNEKLSIKDILILFKQKVLISY